MATRPNIEPLFDAGKYKEAADFLPAPDEMENDYGTIKQTSVPAETIFYSIRQDRNCAFKKKSGQVKHKLFFFCKDLNLCLNATGEDETLPVWKVSTMKELKIIRIKNHRRDFFLPFWGEDGYDESLFNISDDSEFETILYYYLMKHKLDGFEAINIIDQGGFGFNPEMPEFAFLEDVVEKEIKIQRFLSVRDFLQQKRKRKRNLIF